MQNAPKITEIKHMVVRLIANGTIMEVETDSEDLAYCFKTYRQVLRFRKSLEAA